MAHGASYVTVIVDFGFDPNPFRWDVLETWMMVSFYDELRLINWLLEGR